MSLPKRISMLSVAVLAGLSAHCAPGAIITQYSFSATTLTPSPTEAATTGTGVATALGMTNNYSYANGEGPGSVDGSNITLTPGTANPSFSEYTYRIVGNGNKANSGVGVANGWNNSAPNYTQGAEFGANTVGFTPTQVSFDWYATTQGVGNLQVRYTLDGTTFTNLGADLVATPNDYYNASTGSPNVTLSLASLPAGAANDPLFAIELVSVHPAAGDSNFAAFTAADTSGGADYASASGADYNNQSGNWRFDNISVSGTALSATPEPASAAVIGLASLALLNRRKAK